MRRKISPRRPWHFNRKQFQYTTAHQTPSHRCHLQLHWFRFEPIKLYRITCYCWANGVASPTENDLYWKFIIFVALKMVFVYNLCQGVEERLRCCSNEYHLCRLGMLSFGVFFGGRLSLFSFRLSHLKVKIVNLGENRNNFPAAQSHLLSVNSAHERLWSAIRSNCQKCHRNWFDGQAITSLLPARK